LFFKNPPGIFPELISMKSLNLSRAQVRIRKKSIEKDKKIVLSASIAPHE
jgi:hypothetical protein